MPDLENSQRRIYKATHVSIRASEEDEKEGIPKKIGRPIEKINFLRSLNVTPGEVGLLIGTRNYPKKSNLKIEQRRSDKQREQRMLRIFRRNRSTRHNLRVAHRSVARSRVEASSLEVVIEVLKLLNDNTGVMLNSRLAPLIKPISAEFISSVGYFFGEERKRAASNAFSQQNELVREHQQKSRTSSLLGQYALPRSLKKRTADAETRIPNTQNLEFAALDSSAKADLMNWGLTNGSTHADALRNLLRVHSRSHESHSSIELVTLPAHLRHQSENSIQLTDAFIEMMAVQPVGRLHLERIDMTPAGVERGELVSSIPLAPQESVNVGTREWSIRTEDYERVIQDTLDNFSEEGVTEKNDLSQSTQSEQRHQSAFSLSGSYSYAGSSVSIGYNSSSADQSAQEESRQESIALTRKASSRVKQEHKQSMRTNSVLGQEDQSTRTITNFSTDERMRVDYFQLIRRWRSELFRYGLRMTYDIVVPDPGKNLIEQLKILRELNAQIDEPFAMNIKPDQIDRNNWVQRQSEYGVEIEPPPESNRTFRNEYVIQHRAAGDAAREGGFVELIDFSIDSDYVITGGRLRARMWPDHSERTKARFVVERATMTRVDETEGQRFEADLSHLAGATGDLSFVISYRWMVDGSMVYSFDLELRPHVYSEWQFRSWLAIREASEQAHLATRQILIDQRQQLLEKMKASDALTLRRMEREEIMLGVLRWLLGPSIVLMTEDVETLLDDSLPTGPSLGAVTEEDWQRVLAYGEVIKFLHQAIEWENVMFFTYPYFWDTTDSREFKKFLTHPDPRHRDFLRSGAARVVLTIRPGFEVAFAEFVESGIADSGHPYLTIAEEIETYARTNYPGIPPANAADASVDETVVSRERGTLIGRWYEYTPTSALDISLTTDLGQLG